MKIKWKNELMNISGQVYYAHSMKIYNTKREFNELKYLSRYFIIKNILNPNGKIRWNPETKMDPYFEVVRNSKLIIVSEYKKHVGRGVFDEINTVLNNKIPVYCLRKELFGFKLKKIKSTKKVGSDWKIYYGKLILEK